jgi:predicted O-methyltransferase YrrM
MSQETWTAVDAYFEHALLPQDPSLVAVQRACDDAGLPPISVSPQQGRFLALLVQTLAAQRVLEVGTLGGYSTIWMARALPPSGHLLTLELDAHHAEVARANFEDSGVADRVELRQGPALDSLAALRAERPPPFDLVFIDADKVHNLDYARAGLGLARPGSLIVVDNVVRAGAVIEGGSRDASVQGVRRFVEWLASEPRLEAAALQTVGRKGYDGFAMARVCDPARGAEGR